MPNERLISPAVVTREIDQTFLPEGIEAIPGLFVGPTSKGPAFTPTLVNSAREYRRLFGEGRLYTDIAVQNYLTEAGSAFIMRLLPEGVGYVGDLIEIRYDAEGPGGDTSILPEDFLLSVLAPTRRASDFGGLIDATIDGSLAADSVDNLSLELVFGDGTVTTYIVSLDPEDSNYIKDVFGSSVDGSREVYVKYNFAEVNSQITTGTVDVEFLQGAENFDGQTFDHAETPWITSQDTMPDDPVNTMREQLFKFATISDGTAANREVKVAIADIRFAQNVPGSNYGTFSVLVRELGDTDRRPRILEQFENVNLNPASPQYIKRVIGDRTTEFRDDGKLVDRGEYQNRSDYIRVIMNEDIERSNDNGRDDFASLVPWGFADYQFPAKFETAPPHGVKMRLTQRENENVNDLIGVPEPDNPSGAIDNRIYYGFDFSIRANLNYLAPIPANAADRSDPNDFVDLKFGFSLSDALEVDDATPTGSDTGNRKFILGFQGGFDGQDPTTPQNLGDDIIPTNSQGLDMSDFEASGTRAYEKAFGIMSNQDEFDFNLLVTPGVIKSFHSRVVELGIDMVEGRGDAFYIFDPTPVGGSISDTITEIQTIDSSYAGTYYPWLRIQDNATNRIIEVPPSVLMPRVYAFSDRVGEEWFAPAGFNRGGIPEAIEAVTRVTKPERDLLYADRINPIAQYRGDVIVFGQKTLQAQASALDRINVRRLLINVKKFIASTSQFLLFEQNTVETRAQFLNNVNPFLERVQQRAGLFAFRVQMDEDNNPPEVIDRNQLVGEIFLQPTRAAEFIVLDFNLLPTGAEFPTDE